MRKAVAGCLIVLIASSVVVWHRYHHARVSGGLELEVRRTVGARPELEPLFDELTSDDVLSMSDVEQIITAAEAMSETE